MCDIRLQCDNEPRIDCNECAHFSRKSFYLSIVAICCYCLCWSSLAIKGNFVDRLVARVNI